MDKAVERVKRRFDNHIKGLGVAWPAGEVFAKKQGFMISTILTQGALQDCHLNHLNPEARTWKVFKDELNRFIRGD